MRTLTAMETQALACPEYAVWKKITVKDSDGTEVNLCTLQNMNWVKDAKYGETIDQPVATTNLTLFRNMYYWSLATQNMVSGLNKNAAGAYSPLILPGREAKIYTATVPVNYTPVTADYREVFHGYIDDCNFPKDRTGEMPVADVFCRDSLGQELQDQFIETEANYGANDLSKDLEEVIQDILTAWNTGITIYTPAASSMAIVQYTQARESLANACETLANQRAWSFRRKWDSGTSAWRYTLYEPDRTKSVADYTFTTGQYFSPEKVGMSINGIRTVIEVVVYQTDGTRLTLQYPENGTASGAGTGNNTLADTDKTWTVNEWTGYELWIVGGTGVGQHETISSNTATQITVDTNWTTNPDNTSVYAVVTADDSTGYTSTSFPYIQWGRRFMSITEDATRQIKTIANARVFATGVYRDLSRMDMEMTVQVRYFYAAELGDLYTFEADNNYFTTDQTLAVVGIQHDLLNDITTLSLRGKPAGMYEKWFGMEGRSGIARPIQVIIPDTPTNLTATSGIQKISLTWSHTSNVYDPVDYYEIQRREAAAEFDSATRQWVVPASPSWGSYATIARAYTNSYTDPGIDYNEVNQYQVRAVTRRGNQSAWSTATAPTAGTQEGIPSQTTSTDLTQTLIETTAESIFWDLQYYNERNTKIIDYCESGFTDNSWPGTAGTWGTDAAALIGTYSITVTSSVDQGGICKEFTRNLSIFADGSASTTDDYICFGLFILLANLTKVNTGFRLRFFCDAKPTTTNRFIYIIAKADLTGNQWNYFKIKKSDFTTSGSPDWATITGYDFCFVGAPSSSCTFNFDAFQLVRCDPETAEPNPFQREVNGVFQREFEIINGHWWIGLETGTWPNVVCKNLDNSSSGPNLVSVYQFAGNWTLEGVMTAGINSNCFGIEWKSGTNVLRTYVWTGNLYLDEYVNGGLTNTVSTAVTVIAGDTLYYQLSRNGSSVTLKMLKNGNLTASYLLNLETTLDLITPGYLAQVHIVNTWGYLNHYAISRGNYVTNAGIAEMAQTVLLKQKAGAFTAAELRPNQMGIDTSNNRLYVLGPDGTLRYASLT